MSSDLVNLWSNGTEFCMWESQNCDVCIYAPGENEDYNDIKCERYKLICDAMALGGLKLEDAVKIGYVEGKLFMQKCPGRLLEGEIPEHLNQLHLEFEDDVDDEGNVLDYEITGD